jgi:IS30 family transposase
MNSYSHLSLEEREVFFALLLVGKSLRSIGAKLKRSHSTLSREIKRNSPYFQEYIPCKAQKKYENRCTQQRRKAPLKSPEILLYVRDKLRIGWSPGTISGRLLLDKGQHVHPETVYRYIYKKETRKERLWVHLTLKRKKRMKLEGRRPRRESRITNAISIEQRPQKVLSRSDIGNWETDLMLGKRETGQALLVNVERKSRFAVITKIPNKGAQTTSANMIRILKQYKPLTITSDNGLENAKHEYVSKQLNTKYFFCHPYSSWEKGSVENRIGVIRRYIPKGSDLQNYSHTQIGKLQDLLNNTPMKCLGYLTPTEYLKKEGFMI